MDPDAFAVLFSGGRSQGQAFVGLDRTTTGPMRFGLNPSQLPRAYGLGEFLGVDPFKNIWLVKKREPTQPLGKRKNEPHLWSLGAHSLTQSHLSKGASRGFKLLPSGTPTLTKRSQPIGNLGKSPGVFCRFEVSRRPYERAVSAFLVFFCFLIHGFG